MKKLNWGCGSIQPKDWDNIDKDYNFYNGTDQNFYSGTQDMADNTYDIIVAHASIQQIEWHDLVKELKELHRILKPKGVIRISLPDIEAAFANFQMGNKEWFPNGENSIEDRFSAWLTWYSTSKILLTPYALDNKLREAGFHSSYKAEFKVTRIADIEITKLDTRENEFYFVEATK